MTTPPPSPVVVRNVEALNVSLDIGKIVKNRWKVGNDERMSNGDDHRRSSRSPNRSTSSAPVVGAACGQGALYRQPRGRGRAEGSGLLSHSQNVVLVPGPPRMSEQSSGHISTVQSIGSSNSAASLIAVGSSGQESVSDPQSKEFSVMEELSASASNISSFVQSSKSKCFHQKWMIIDISQGLISQKELKKFVDTVMSKITEKHGGDLLTFGYPEIRKFVEFGKFHQYLSNVRRFPTYDFYVICTFSQILSEENKKIVLDLLNPTNSMMIFYGDKSEAAVKVVDKICQSQLISDIRRLTKREIEDLSKGPQRTLDDILSTLHANRRFHNSMNVPGDPKSVRSSKTAASFVALFRRIFELSEQEDLNRNNRRQKIDELLIALVSSEYWRVSLQVSLELIVRKLLQYDLFLVDNEKLVVELLPGVIALLIYILRYSPTVADQISEVVKEVRKILDSNVLKRNSAIYERLKDQEETVKELCAEFGQGHALTTAVQLPDDEDEVELPPANSFRQLGIFPSNDELKLSAVPRLRKNIVDRPYKSLNEYLDVHIRLLREDFVRPLREGIAFLLDDEYVPRDEQIDDRARLKVHVFENVRFCRVDDSDNCFRELTYLVTFYSQQLNWNKLKRSKLLRFGSLLCFSSDQFQTTILATISRADEEDLRKGRLFVVVHRGEPNFGQLYQMVESPVYFEGYRHVLNVLMNINNQRDMAFSKYIIECRPNTERPNYLGTLSKKFNLKCLLKNSENSTCDVTDPTSWPNLDLVKVNASQYEAIKSALTKRLAIVQGPPGTGKTFVALILLQILIDNSLCWHIIGEEKPILVICQTNHALDQLLIGINQFVKDHIIRIGSQSKNPDAVKNFLLKNVQHLDHYKVPVGINRRLQQAMAEKERCDSEIDNWKKTLDLLDTTLLNYRALNGEILCQNVVEKEEWVKQIVNVPWTKLSEDQSIAVWLTSFKRKVPKMPVNVNTLRRLMAFTKFDQIPCVNALVLKRNVFETAANFLFSCIQDPRLYFPLIASVPQLSDVDEIMRKYGISQEDAVFALLECGLNVDDALELLQAENKISLVVRDESEVGREENELHLDLDDADSDLLDDLEVGVELENEEDVVNDKPVGSKYLVQATRDDTFGGGVFELQTGTNFGVDALQVLDGERKTVKIPPRIFSLIMQATPMSGDDVDKVGDIWQLTLKQRWSLYRRWVKKFQAKIQEKIDQCVDTRLQAWKHFEQCLTFKNVHIFKKAKIIGMTTTGAAKHHIEFQMVRPKIVLVEEAAKVLESHVVASLSSSCEHVILIGDHQQLRPKTAVYELSKEYKLDVSLFERLINNGFESSVLRQQHRMQAQICNTLLKDVFYENLINDADVESFGNVKGVGKNLFFFNHSHREDLMNDATYRRNQFEAEMIVEFRRYLLNQGYTPSQITVLCGYSGQVECISKMMEIRLVVQSETSQVTTVDNFQGEQCEIILLSLARSNSEKKIGFMSISNRVCVALSRAQWGLYCFGNFDQLQCSSKDVWAKIIERVKGENCFGTALPLVCQNHPDTKTMIEKPDDFKSLVPDGGCLLNCTYLMNCGHQCANGAISTILPTSPFGV